MIHFQTNSFFCGQKTSVTQTILKNIAELLVNLQN